MSFFSKMLGIAVPGPFGVIFTKNVKREAGQICNIFFAIFYYKIRGEMPKMAKFAAANEPAAIYIYMHTYEQRQFYANKATKKCATFVCNTSKMRDRRL